MKIFTNTKFFLVIVFGIISFSLFSFSFAATNEAQRSSTESTRVASSESPREWAIGTYYASPEAVRTVTVAADPIIIEKIVDREIEVEVYHSSAPAPLPEVLQNTGMASNILFLLFGIFLLGGGITLNRKK